MSDYKTTATSTQPEDGVSLLGLACKVVRNPARMVRDGFGTSRASNDAISFAQQAFALVGRNRMVYSATSSRQICVHEPRVRSGLTSRAPGPLISGT